MYYHIYHCVLLLTKQTNGLPDKHTFWLKAVLNENLYRQ